MWTPSVALQILSWGQALSPSLHVICMHAIAAPKLLLQVEICVVQVLLVRLRHCMPTITVGVRSHMSVRLFAEDLTSYSACPQKLGLIVLVVHS